MAAVESISVQLQYRRFAVDGYECTWSDLFKANDFEECEIRELMRLDVGESMTFGGGAFAEISVERVA